MDDAQGMAFARWPVRSRPAVAGTVTKVCWSAVALLTALGLAGVFAAFPEYWNLRDHYARIRCAWEMEERYAFSAREAAAEHARAEEQHRAAGRHGRVTGSIRGVFDWSVADLAVQPDGRILVAGEHNEHGLGIARLLPDGRLDEDFVRRANADLAPDVTGRAEQIALAPDGAVVIAGAFNFEGAPRMLMRFQSDGTLDRGFMARTASLAGGQGSLRPRVVVQPDGALLLLRFAAPGAAPLLLGQDGVSLGPPSGRTSPKESYVVGADGVVLGVPPGVPADGLTVRAVSSGSDALRTAGAFALPDGRSFQYLGVGRDGRALLIVSKPDEYKADEVARPLRTRFCGAEDRVYPYLSLIDSRGVMRELMPEARLCERSFSVWTAAFQRDGGVILAGDLPLAAEGEGCRHIALWRVRPDGAVDPAFRMTAGRELSYSVGDPSPSEGTGTLVSRILALDDGRLLIGGGFNSVQGHERRHLAVVRADGSLEPEG